MKINCFSLLLITFLFNGLTVSAQSWLWGARGSSLGATIYNNGIATNRTGNVYLTGSFEDTIVFGAITLTSSFPNDNLFLVKYNQTGTAIWASAPAIRNGNNVVGTSVATDDSDNSYVTGFEISTTTNTDTVTFGSDTLYLPSKGNVFLVKYNANGNVLWAKQPDTTLFTYGAAGEAVTTDKFGHEYVTGSDGATFLIKYDRNGNTLWTVKLPVDTPLFSSGGYGVATDVFGNVYMTGYFHDSLKFGTTTLYSKYYEVFIAKFDSSGHVLWAQQSNSNSAFGIDIGEGNPSIATDQSGAVYLTSIFAVSIAFGPYTFTSFDSADNFYVVKYAADGTIAWGKEAVSSNSGLTSYSICSDDSNHIYIAGEQYQLYGYSDSLAFVFANYTFRFIDTSFTDPVFLLKLDSSGNVFCRSTLFFSDGDYVNALTSDSTGKFVYLSGMYSNPFEIGGDSLIDSTGGSNTYIARWQPCYELTGINQIPAGNNQLSIYPNPANNQITVKINTSATDLSGWHLKLIDILGRTIYSMPSLNYTNIINLETLPAAMYFVTVTNNTGRTVVPVVKVN